MQNKELLKVEGYILSSQKYKEKDAILKILTPKGILTVFGSSYKSPKSKYHILNNILLKVNIVGQINSGNILKIKDYDVLNYNYVNFFTYEKLMNIFKIINLLKKNDYNDAQIYTDFEYILQNINEASVLEEENYLYYICCKILKKNGIDLNFKTCIVCGTKEKFKTLSIVDGGLLCHNCYQNEKLINLEDIKKVYKVFNKNIEEVYKIELSKEIKAQILNLLNESLGIYIK